MTEKKTPFDDDTFVNNVWYMDSFVSKSIADYANASYCRLNVLVEMAEYYLLTADERVSFWFEEVNPQ